MFKGTIKLCIHTKINVCVEKALYVCILNHSKVAQSPIYNYCLKLLIYGQERQQLVPKLLCQVSVRELYNSTMIPPKERGMKDTRDTEDNTIIIDSTLCNLLSPQPKKMTAQ